MADSKLLMGKTIGIDATTLEANAAMRSIVRKDTGESYEKFLTGLAKASGIDTPTREQLAKLDKKRKNKASNGDWENPNDPDAKITKMKDDRTPISLCAGFRRGLPKTFPTQIGGSGAVRSPSIRIANRTAHGHNIACEDS